jgi:hypothetical protein
MLGTDEDEAQFCRRAGVDSLWWSNEVWGGWREGERETEGSGEV